MRMDGRPPPGSLGKQQGGAAGPREGCTVSPRTKRIPGNDDAYDFAIAESPQVVESKGEFANVRPDIAPLLVLQAVAAGNNLGIRPERDDVLGKQSMRPMKIDAANASLHFGQERTRDGIHL